MLVRPESYFRNEDFCFRAGSQSSKGRVVTASGRLPGLLRRILPVPRVGAGQTHHKVNKVSMANVQKRWASSNFLEKGERIIFNKMDLPSESYFSLTSYFNN